MKKILLLAVLFISALSFSQSFTEFKNDDFSIQFPENWIVVPKEKMPELAFVAYRKPDNSKDKAQISINMNVINTPNSTLEKSILDLVYSLKETDDFTLLENGNIEIASQPFKWLKETHANHRDKSQKMDNYVFLTYKNNKTYILTVASFSEVFDNYKPLFDKIANSLVIK